LSQKSSPVSRYARTAVIVAVLALALAWLALPGSLRQQGGWLALGWALMSLGHVAGGCWMAARHGRPGSGFLVALGTSMIGRFVMAIAGGVATWFAGEAAAVAYVAGLGLGFVPLQTLESVWFLRASRTGAATSGPALQG
jgi:hypothetical protein